jgi:hypothetical protein
MGQFNTTSPACPALIATASSMPFILFRNSTGIVISSQLVAAHTIFERGSDPAELKMIATVAPAA